MIYCFYTTISCIAVFNILNVLVQRLRYWIRYDIFIRNLDGGKEKQVFTGSLF